MGLLVGIAAVAALAVFGWAAIWEAQYPAPWSMPWQVARVGRGVAAGNAAIRLVALVVAGAAIYLVGAVPPLSTSDVGVGWFPSISTPRPSVIRVPDVTWLGLVVGAIVLALFVAPRLRRLSRTKRIDPTTAAATSGDTNAGAAIQEESLLDVRSEQDPRRGILLCYMHMEHTLSRRGMPREPSETALEYAWRLLAKTGAPPAQPIQSLTRLFHLAGFSAIEVNEEMRKAAIDSLQAITEMS